MPVRSSLPFWLSSLLCLGLVTAGAAPVGEAPDSAPQRLAPGDDALPWKNTKQLKAYAAKGDPQACFELGTRLLAGDDEVAADLTRARALLETAAAGGVADAHFRLGKIYHDGRGVPRDYAQALAYYTTAARGGVPEAQHNIGAMLVSARGVKRDFVEGLAWLLLAEEFGAASTTPQQVRDHLAKKPATIRAAEARAKELAADLPHATVRTGTPLTRPIIAPPPVAPTVSPPAPVITAPVIAPTLPLPQLAPLAPIPISLPPASPPVPPPAR